MYLEIEYTIENVIAMNRRREGHLKMYKGQPKKWQVLNDDAFD